MGVSKLSAKVFSKVNHSFKHVHPPVYSLLFVFGLDMLNVSPHWSLPISALFPNPKQEETHKAVNQKSRLRSTRSLWRSPTRVNTHTSVSRWVWDSHDSTHETLTNTSTLTFLIIPDRRHVLFWVHLPSEVRMTEEYPSTPTERLLSLHKPFISCFKTPKPNPPTHTRAARGPIRAQEVCVLEGCVGNAPSLLRPVLPDACHWNNSTKHTHCRVSEGGKQARIWHDCFWSGSLRANVTRQKQPWGHLSKSTDTLKACRTLSFRGYRWKIEGNRTTRCGTRFVQCCIDASAWLTSGLK